MKLLSRNPVNCFRLKSSLLTFFITCLFLSNQGQAVEPPEPLRIAVLADTESWDGALTLAEVELSQQDGIQMVDRQGLDTQLQEWGLQAAGLTHEDEIRLGRSLRADGIIRIHQEREDRRDIWVMTLSGVEAGAILAAESFRELPAALDNQADLISAFFQEHRRLLSVPPAKGRALTVLPVSIHISRLDMLDLEQRMGRWMISCLTRGGDLAVLDRERAGDFVFDQFFTRGATGEYWKSGGLLYVEIPPGENGDGPVRLQARLQFPSGDQRNIASEPFDLDHDWQTAVEDLAMRVLQELDVAPSGDLSSDALQTEARAMGDLAIRLYEFDVDRGLHYADLAYSMGNRSRDVYVIRTQTRLQDLFANERTPKMPELGALPPTLMNAGTFNLQKRNEQRQMPAAEPRSVMAKRVELPVAEVRSVMEKVEDMLADLIRNVDGWSGEKRGWIPLKNVLAHAISIQKYAAMHSDRDELKPFMKQHAETLRKAVSWLREQGQDRNPGPLAWTLDRDAVVIFEHPEELMRQWSLSFMNAEDFEMIERNYLDLLQRMAGITQEVPKGVTRLPVHSVLVPVDEDAYAKARADVFDAMAAHSNPLTRVCFLHAAVYWPDALSGQWTDERLEPEFIRTALDLVQRDQELPGLRHLRELVVKLDKRRPGSHLRFTRGFMRESLNLLQEIWPTDTDEPPDSTLRDQASNLLAQLYSTSARDARNLLPREDIIRFLRVATDERLKGPKEAAEWLAMLDIPSTAEDSYRGAEKKMWLYRPSTPTQMETTQFTSLDDPVYMPGSMNFALYSLGRHWRYDRRSMTLTGTDPEGEREEVRFLIPPPETPQDVLYSHTLKPIAVGKEWVVFISERFLLPNRGRLAAFRRSDGFRTEHFPREKGSHDFFRDYGQMNGHPGQGHLHGNLFFFTTARTKGQQESGIRPASEVYRLNLETGEMNLITQHKHQGDFPHSQNPPNTQGHFFRWGEEASVFLRAQAIQKTESVRVELHYYRPETGEWTLEVQDLPELWGGRNQDPEIAVIAELPGKLMIKQHKSESGNGSLIDLENGKWLSQEEGGVFNFQYDPDQLASVFPHEPEIPIEGKARYRPGVRLGNILYSVDQWTKFPYEKTFFEEGDSEYRALSGDGEAALLMAAEYAEEGISRFRQDRKDPGDMGLASIFRAMFWCRKASEAGHPGAAGALSHLMISQSSYLTDTRLLEPQIFVSREEKDPWGTWAAALQVPPDDLRGEEWGGNRLELALDAAESGVLPALEWLSWTRCASMAGREDREILAYAAASALEEIQAAPRRDRLPASMLEQLYDVMNKRKVYNEIPPGEHDLRAYTAEALYRKIPPEKRSEAKSFAAEWVPRVVAAWRKPEASR